jgi:hypothetical protein
MSLRSDQASLTVKTVGCDPAGAVPSIVFSGRMRALAHAGLPLVGAARLTAPSGLVPIG